MSAPQLLTGWHGSLKSNRFGLRFGLLRELLVGRPKTITLQLEAEMPIAVKVPDGFWNKCPEVCDSSIRDWMHKQGITYPWTGGRTPKFPVKIVGQNSFAVSKADQQNLKIS